ncbi:MAG TPA: oligosaccharide flippase family protein [Tissierellaceae bacterium]|nr:oligosaccharide flippase family protein [Tissierellaceae bacterium]
MVRTRFIYDSIIMILVNIFVRIIDFAYEVVLSKFLGPEGIGLFQISTTTLMVFLSITTSGIPMSVTKLVAEENAKRNHKNVETIYSTTILLNLCISILLSIVIVLFSDFIAINIFKNKEMIYGVYLLVPALIIMSITRVLESFFYGMKNMIIPSIAEIIESTARLIIITTIFYYFSNTNPIYGAMIAILGISIGELCDLIWSLLSKNKTRISRSKENIFSGFSIRFAAKILFMSLPLMASGFFSIILKFINTIMIPSRLMIAGYTNKSAMEVFGRITGMAMPLIHLPFMVTSAVVINLITSLSRDMVLKNFNKIKSDIQLTIKVTLLISLPLMSLLIVFSKTLSIFLYNDPQVGEYIRILGYGTVLSALQYTLSGILFGIGKEVDATRNRLLGLILRVILIYFLVGDPKLHIYGFFIAFYMSNILILILDIISLKRSVDVKFNCFDILGKPLIGSIFMIGYIQLSTYDIKNLPNISIFNFIFILGIAFLSYLLILIITKAIPNDIIGRITKNIVD